MIRTTENKGGRERKGEIRDAIKERRYGVMRKKRWRKGEVSKGRERKNKEGK